MPKTQTIFLANMQADLDINLRYKTLNAFNLTRQIEERKQNLLPSHWNDPSAFLVIFE